MKTFYLIQNDALEDYLNGSNGGPSNPGGGDTGNGCESVCANANPTSQAYKNCGCDGGEPGASIDSNLYLGLFIGLVIGIYFIFKKRKL